VPLDAPRLIELCDDRAYVLRDLRDTVALIRHDAYSLSR
jgi:hypothetical protein